MQGVKLKRIVDFLWKSPSAFEEETPIVPKKNKVTDNGTITMDRNFSSDDIFKTAGGKKFVGDSIESRKEEPSRDMSPLRKLCFFLSLNGGVMYFVVLAYLLPCRMWTCSESGQQWQFNLTNAQITTNLEANSQENPTLVVFGYSTNKVNKLSALKISDGTLKWKRTFPEKSSHIFCNLHKVGPSVRKDVMCLVTAEDTMEAFNSENGWTFWKRNITSEQKLSKVIITHESQHKAYLVGISNDFMHVLDVMNGTELSTIQLPCSWTVGVKVAGPWRTKAGLMWALVCEYEDGLEVYTFKETELLNFSGAMEHPGANKIVNFKSLFSYQSYSGSIDLASDVTSTPHSLVLSWADMVSMVSAQAPSHHFQKTWERSFSSPHGYLQEVTSVSIGNFENAHSSQVAVALKQGSNSSIHFLEMTNGSTINEAELGTKVVLWMKKIPGLKGENDRIVIETVDRNSSFENKNTSTKSYFLLDYDGSELDMTLLATADQVHGSLLIPSTKGNSNLLLARTSPDGSSIINRFPIQNRKPNDSFCGDVKHTYTVLLLE